MNTYTLIITVSIIIILSFLFNILARRTNFPSVLLLISLGIGVKFFANSAELEANLFPVLEVLGVVGLIMIVLEAALDLELRKEKAVLILKSMFIALIGLVLSSLLIAFILQSFISDINFLTSLIYAIPLSIMSSAIIIPSVANLHQETREFMIYESTFSDIFGIMFFYYVLGNANTEGFKEVVLNVSTNLVTTLVISLVLGYVMVWGLQALKTRTKFILILALLMLLYSLGKMMHISSLLIILVFGLILNNRAFFFRGKMDKIISNKNIDRLLDDFKQFTAETAFVVRTFFFVFFGMSLTLTVFTGKAVWILSGLILLALFVIRFGLFKAIKGKKMYPEVWIAPRGLITILLFFAIPVEYKVTGFENGVLFVVIIVTALIMALSLMLEKKHAIEPDSQELDLPFEE